MLSKNHEYQSFEISEALVPVASVAHTEDALDQAIGGTPTKFYGRYHDSMEMYAQASLVAEYLNAHSSWFSRCAEPMKVQPLGENGYALGIGRFGSFGYQVEPKIGLELLPPEDGIYRIHTIPIPDYYPPGYDVDYNASMRMIEGTASSPTSISSQITRVEWELDLVVDIHFPNFIQRLPKSLVQSTGDRVLNQVVRQISKRLTRKVQQDFHQSLGIDFPVNQKKR